MEILIKESSGLYRAICDVVADESIYFSERSQVCNCICSMSTEHSASILTLAAHGYHISAAGMLRLQFEALIRAIWVWFIASDQAVSKFSLPLSRESLQAAKNLPGVNDMLKALLKSNEIPKPMLETLENFQSELLKDLHSLVHSGLLPVALYSEGVPESMQVVTIKNSNLLVVLAGAMMGFLTQSHSVMQEMNNIPRRFESCLPGPAIYHG